MNTSYTKLQAVFYKSLQKVLRGQNKFNFAIVHIKPLQHTKPHHHHELEGWIILEGKGILTSDNKICPVKKGDVIQLLPLQTHTLQNISEKANLVYISFWWSDLQFFEKTLKSNEKKQKTTAKILILPSFPTPNGTLHVGHLAGPYIAADVYKRYQQIMSRDVHYLSGTIGYQTQVAYKSQQLGLNFHDTAEIYSEQIINTLSAANIQPDVFIRPTKTPHYSHIMQTIFSDLLHQGYLTIKEMPALYCATCKKHLFEAYVKGGCPHCRYANATSNECEKCAMVYNDGELINPTCNTCNQPAELKPLTRVFFALEPFKNQLLHYYQQIQLSNCLQRFIDIAFAKKLPEIPVSYIAKDGIPVPLKNLPQQYIYSQFELAGRYLAAVTALAKQLDDSSSWESICQHYTTKLFFGYDNAFLRMIIFPAVLLAYNKNIQLPDLMISNEFYNLDNSKFSTSRGHVITGDVLIKNYSADSVRLYLCYTRPEDKPSNFCLTDFDKFIQDQLINNWEQWLNTLALRLENFYNNTPPEPGLWSQEAKNYFQQIKAIAKNIEHFYADPFFSPRGISHELIRLIEISKYFSDSTADYYKFSTLYDKARTHIALELMAARCLAIYSWPIMPEFAEKLWYALGYRETIQITKLQPAIEWLSSQKKITLRSQPFFSKLLIQEVHPHA